MGTAVLRFAYSAMIGACAHIFEIHYAEIKRGELTMIPKIRFAVATSAFPVPRSLVGKSSGETA